MNLFDISDDDSLLKPVPFGNNPKSKPIFKKVMDPIFIDDQLDDDDNEIILKSPIKTKSQDFKSNSQLETKNVPELITLDDDDEIVEKNHLSAQKQYTEIKDFSINSSPIKPSDEIFNKSPRSHNSQDWILFDDDSGSAFHSTPTNLFHKTNKIKKKSIFKSGKRSLLSSRTKIVKQNTIQNKNRKLNKINKNLFNRDDDNEDFVQNQNNKISIKQEDALNYISIKINSCLFQLAEQQFLETFLEKGLNYETIENDIDYCVTWKCRPQLEALINEVNRNENYLFKLIKVLDSATFDHLLILIPSDKLHEYLDSFLDSLNDGHDDQNELFNVIQTYCHKYSIYNVTLIIYKMEQHLRSQRGRLDNSFKRRVNDLMSDSQQPTTNKKKTNKQKLHKHEMTADNVDMLLIDCKNKFLFNFHEVSQRNDNGCKLTIVNIDNEQELALTLFRYSRSISEQIFRSSRQSGSNIDFFAQAEKSQTIDPVDENGRRALWLRQLQQFPNISNDIAEAIANVYSSPQQLMNAIEKQSRSSSSNPVSMLAEISNNKNKRVGIELATKIYLFMTSNHPDQVLKTGINMASSTASY